uniref:PHD-type domain-containing protein n=1 Tax=Leersia perrieri TaxID=77586 RepID=A0A0D9X2I4_9ORYZ
MEGLVGRAVRKGFPGFGVFDGVVESYDSEAGYFRVMYEDGDSEEVEFGEVEGMLVGSMPPILTGASAAAASPGGRRPKKRRRADEGGAVTVGMESDSVVLAVPAGGVMEEEEEEVAASPVVPAVERGRDEEDGDVVTEMVEKKRKAAVVSPGPESGRPLRRSARQAKAAARAAEMEAAAAAAEAEAAAAAAAAAEAEAETEVEVTPKQSGSRRRRANGTGRFRSVAKDLEDAAEEKLPPKPDLPASSQNLDLEGLPVLDVFQVYSCLRSFSRQLFLSPFSVEAFVVALRCMYVNPLIDWVHFCLLRAMKSHLEDLANEGDPPAVHCIRNLNWELLDLATWPIYLAEYLLTRGSELRYGMKLTDLNLLNTEYYIQPAVVKLELLRALCDDVLDIEAIRSEVSLRMSELDGNAELCRSTGKRRKRRTSVVKGIVDTSLTPEESSDTEDRNSDECYLCGMDGNLLCCDGCPAAFHSKCVGVVEDQLPEGDWFCPECLIQKNDGFRNTANPGRGAEVLGTDPHGRLYIGTCGYLLVVESTAVDSLDSPCHYYGHFDHRSLFNVLIPCHSSYSSIIDAISLFWGSAIESFYFNGRYENSKQPSIFDVETDCNHLLSSKQHIDHGQLKSEKNGSASGRACSLDSDPLDHDASDHEFSLRSAVISENGNATSDKTQQDVCSCANGLPAENQKDQSPHKMISDCYMHSKPAMYVNYYSFGQTAASAAQELKDKLSENKEGKKPGHDAASFQLKTICKKYATYFALTDQKLSVELLKEKCGWCNSCQISGGVDCIFRVTDGKCMEGLRSEKIMKSHITLAIHIILSLEERLNGLLIGPWKNPQFSIYWHKEVLKASDVSSLKWPLLMLESNLRPVAFSVEWQKPADSVEVVGSAAHVLVRTSNKSSRLASARKPGRKPSNIELKVDSRDVGVDWRRGGRLSRQVFHWKRLPQSLAHKAARQAGRIKIPTILYNDGSEFARRSKYIAWRAAVEMAENVAQLILQIKELEFNIKWTEILNTLPASLATKESQKIARLFKKVIVRRKHVEGTNVEYLLDFGKRENIPPVIAKHGKKLDDPSSERNRYWLSEGHIPLSLLKAYEAKALTRLLKKKDIDHLRKKITDLKPSKPKKSGFDYLLEKAKKQVVGLCGHCDKEVNTSDAVNCQYCEALFHKKHFKVPKGAADAYYVCNKCLAEKILKVKSPQKKAASKKASPKKKPKKQSRKIVTRKNQVVVNLNKKMGKTKGKRGRPRKYPLNVSKNESPRKNVSKNESPRKNVSNNELPRKNVSKNKSPELPVDEPASSKDEPTKRISKRLYEKYMKGNSSTSEPAAKRRRTASHHSYWLDGLRWTQNPNDDRAISFRKENVVFPCEDVELCEVFPVCRLCQKCYSGESVYIACEDCGDWFHGDIYSITLDNVSNLIGFKCHSCRLKDAPVCPHVQTDNILMAQSDKEDTISRSVEDKEEGCPTDLGADDSLEGLHGRIVEKEVSDHIIEKEVGGDSCLQVLEDHNEKKELDRQSTVKELSGHNYLTGLDDHNKLNDLDGNMEVLFTHNSMEELDSTEDSKHADGEAQCLPELNNYYSLKEFDNYDSSKELDNHNSLEECDSLKKDLWELDNHDCQKECNNQSSPKELENHRGLEELDNQKIPEDLDNHISPEEFDCTGDNEHSAAVTQMDGFLDENFEIRISGKEELTVASESGPIKESIALQPKNNSEENPVPAECDIDLQVVVTL